MINAINQLIERLEPVREVVLKAKIAEMAKAKLEAAGGGGGGGGGGGDGGGGAAAPTPPGEEKKVDDADDEFANVVVSWQEVRACGCVRKCAWVCVRVCVREGAVQ